MTELPTIDTQKFWKDGYLVIKNVFSQEEIKNFREHAEQFYASWDKKSSAGDILSNSDPELYRVIFEPRILHAARSILGGTPVYFGDSTISYGSHHRGWHKDNRMPDRFKHNYPDWNGKYPLIRFGVYLQDHRSHSGGLGVRQGSHEPSRIVNRLDKLKIAGLSDLKNTRLKTRLSILATNNYGKAKIVDNGPGDLVVWNQRTTHSGNAVRLKATPNIKYPTWFENRVSQSLQLPYEDDRVVLFMTYGLKGDHLSRAIEFLKKRRYMVNSWKASEVSEQTLSEIDKDVLEVLPPPEIPDDWQPTMS